MRSKGFTLIELVIVVVVLGILAITAAPKFLSMQSDARSSSIEGLRAALASGATLVYSKAIIEGLASGNANLDVTGDGSGDISIRAGYPRVAASCNTFVNNLQYWVSLTIEASCNANSNADWYGVVEANMFHFMPAGYTSINENCFVTYTTASEFVGGSWIDTDSATIESVTTGC
ncbi:prepilin-type N-terminal cleavage/methylation domain-containing protein [Aliagarivorans marinus]|uniref:prepilin-type N-terminal cleavage/methylation domain-containing protein n=1 Tax=Aliagarivorans marinus TaxID=561965 RepID=UPI0006889AC3|nr:prepilin-type N-terminal cleavage/methylation domain-containing protein [Aliagarivorans marinus]